MLHCGTFEFGLTGCQTMYDSRLQHWTRVESSDRVVGEGQRNEVRETGEGDEAKRGGEGNGITSQKCVTRQVADCE